MTEVFAKCRIVSKEEYIYGEYIYGKNVLEVALENADTALHGIVYTMSINKGHSAIFHAENGCCGNTYFIFNSKSRWLDMLNELEKLEINIKEKNQLIQQIRDFEPEPQQIKR